MTSEEADQEPAQALQRAADAFQLARLDFEKRRDQLAEAIVGAAKAGTSTGDLVRITGYTRENIRLILRKAGVTA